jgi:hypothetical protein
MVKVTYKPFEEIVILDYMQYPLDTLVSLHGLPLLAGGAVPPLNWAEGIVFMHESMPLVESALKEMREDRRVYWMTVMFAEMPEYKPTITTRDGRMTVNVVDVTSNPPFREAAKWLRKHLSK